VNDDGRTAVLNATWITASTNDTTGAASIGVTAHIARSS
jgi:hypothetical protein